MHTELRTQEERVRALHERASVYRKERQRQKYTAMSGAVSCVSALLLVIVTVLIQGMDQLDLPVAGSGGMQGSLLSGSTGVGLVLVIILAFLFGISVTLFAYNMRKLNELKDAGPKDIS